MGILTSNRSDLKSAKEDLLLEAYNNNKIFSTVHKDRLGKDIKDGDMVFCIKSYYGSYDVAVGQIVGFTNTRVKVQSYRKSPIPYLSIDNYAPQDVIRVEMKSIRDMFGIEK